MPLRSILFAPGNESRKVAKVFEFGADAVCLDLEDAVASGAKADARAQVAARLAEPVEVPLYVRINALTTPHSLDDLQAVVRPGLSGIILPMVEKAADLATAEWAVAQLEATRGLAVGSIDILPTIESATAVANLADICRSGTRARRLSFGAWDYTLDTGITYSPDEETIGHVRAQIVVHSRAAGLQAPIDTSYPVIGDLEGLSRSASIARTMGYAGKACIHPEQVSVVNEAFSPSKDELRRARNLVEAFERAEAAGSASIRVDGRFVDYPMYKKAKALLKQAE